MTVEAILQCKAVKGTVQVQLATEDGKVVEDTSEIGYSNDVNEQQPCAEPGIRDNPSSEKTASGFEPVIGVTKAMDDQCKEPATVDEETQGLKPFAFEETIIIFDWDDTILPSAWVQQQGLKLDKQSTLTNSQQEQLSEVANAVMETIRVAKQYGTVVFVTNAERGWIELSCQKFMPTLYPALENIKLLSARTAYESTTGPNPLDWKLNAFNAEITRVFGDDILGASARRKNCISLGDSMHEREALLRATSVLPNCRSKSLKFVERPDISQICKQHSLITGCFNRVIHHDGNLDLCIKCS